MKESVYGERLVKRRAILVLLFIFLCPQLPFELQSFEETEIISVVKSASLVKRLQEIGLDLLLELNNRIYIVATPSDLEHLRVENIPFLFETTKFYPFSQKELFPQGGINGKYHSYRELREELSDLQKRYPRQAKVYILGDSLEKRHIYALKISDNVALDEEEAEVLFLGCHHAREWISVEVPLLFGKYLLENYDQSPEVKQLVDQSEIWLVPLVNPDGLEYSIHFYRYWRKNRRLNSDGSYGVDLNRNYGYKWAYDDTGSSPLPYSAVYRGIAPFSEPETKAIQDLFLKKDFQVLITYHSFSQVILYPWGYTKEPAKEHDKLQQIAAKMAEYIQQVNGNFYEYGQSGQTLYLTNGDTTDWAYGTSSIPSYTIELPPVDELSGGFFNSEEEIDRIFQENLPAMLYLVNFSIQNYESQKSSVSLVQTIDKGTSIR